MRPQQQRPQQGGYPPQQHARPAPQQAAPGNAYPPVGYPEQPSAPPAYEPQQAYHYPQQGQPAPVTAPPGGRRGPSGFDPVTQPPQQGYGSYAQPQPQRAPQPQHAPQPGYGAGRQVPAQQQPAYAPTPTTQPRPHAAPQAAQPRQPAPAQGYRNGVNGVPADYGARQPAAPRAAPPPRYDEWPPAPAPAPQQARGMPPGYGAQQDMGGGYDLGSYMPAGHEADGLPQDLGHVDPLQEQAAWMHPAHADYDAAMEQAFQGADLGYEQGHAGALEPTYNQDEAAEYEYEEPKRGSWVLRIAGAVVVAIGLGYGLAQGYKIMMGSSGDGETPVVHSDAAPARTKPSDPGGKEFAHTDSKIMGRLGDGSADTSDANGARKVTTLQVGRDGSIVPPEAPVQTASNSSAVDVPGVTVIDAFGGNSYGGSVVTTAPEPPSPPKVQPAATSKPIVVNPPEAPSPPPPSAKPEVIAKVTPTKQKTTAAKKPVTTAAVSQESSGANGFVVVLASVPASSNSRLDALKKFADMQMQYGSVLQNKTPDVREANLGERGTYHRLVVGPPGSRSQANQLCSELKTAGYKDCWVMAY